MRSKQVLLVALMATVLCTERIATAAPGVSPHLARTVRQLAVKLTDSFQHVLPDVRPMLRFAQPARFSSPASARPMVLATPAAVVHPSELTPFQFRLPPPLA